jgi:hypothetical protein
MNVNKVKVHVMYIEHVQYWVECVCMGLSERSVPRLMPLSAAFWTEQDRPAATDHYTPTHSPGPQTTYGPIYKEAHPINPSDPCTQ